MKKILVRIPQWLGDAVVSTIFLTQLKKKEPDSHIDVLVKSSFAPIFIYHPSVNKTLLLPAKSFGGVWTAASQIRGQGYDEIYVIPRSARTAMEAILSKIPKRIGFGGDLRSLCFTKTVIYDQKKPYPRKYLALIGDEHTTDSLTPVFPKAQTNWDAIARTLKVSSNFIKKPIMGMAPHSIAPSRTWSKEKFISVARNFLDLSKGTILLLGAPNEAAALHKIKDEIGESVVVDAGDLDFPQLGWVMSELSSFVGNDSGLMHVASAFHVPSVIIFGASNPDVALPLVDGMNSVQNKSISCVPCLRNHCVKFGIHHNECLNSISSDEIWSKLKEKI